MGIRIEYDPADVAVDVLTLTTGWRPTEDWLLAELLRRLDDADRYAMLRDVHAGGRAFWLFRDGVPAFRFTFEAAVDAARRHEFRAWADLVVRCIGDSGRDGGE